MTILLADENKTLTGTSQKSLESDAHFRLHVPKSNPSSTCMSRFCFISLIFLYQNIFICLFPIHLMFIPYLTIVFHLQSPSQSPALSQPRPEVLSCSSESKPLPFHGSHSRGSQPVGHNLRPSEEHRDFHYDS